MLPVKAYWSLNKWYINISYFRFILQIYFSEWVLFTVLSLFKKKLYGPFLWMDSTASRLQSHYEEALYFLPLSYHRSYVSPKSCCQLFFSSDMFCAIWYHSYNLKNVKNTHGGVLLLMKSNTPPRVFFTFLKLYKLYQIAQNITF